MSMRYYLNEKEDVINSIRLQLRHPSGSNKIWVVVEGETDQKFFAKFFDDNVVIEISHGGLHCLLKSVSILIKETDRIFGIRDADFLHLEGKLESNDTIFLTDYHDVEMMIVSCDSAFHQVVTEYVVKENDSVSLRENLLKSIAFIGGLRWLNDSAKLELNFNGLRFGNIYNAQTIQLDEDKCLSDIKKSSPNCMKSITKEDVRSKIKNISDFLNLCNGHDFQKAFALYVTTTTGQGVKDKEIGRAFHVAYRFGDFKETVLFKKLLQWAGSREFPLFKDQ